MVARLKWAIPFVFGYVVIHLLKHAAVDGVHEVAVVEVVTAEFRVLVQHFGDNHQHSVCQGGNG